MDYFLADNGGLSPPESQWSQLFTYYRTTRYTFIPLRLHRSTKPPPRRLSCSRGTAACNLLCSEDCGKTSTYRFSSDTRRLLPCECAGVPSLFTRCYGNAGVRPRVASAVEKRSTPHIGQNGWCKCRLVKIKRRLHVKLALLSHSGCNFTSTLLKAAC